MKNSPHLLQLEKACTQQQTPTTAKKQINKSLKKKKIKAHAIFRKLSTKDVKFALILQ